MTQYRITAERADGATVTQDEIELTESAARKAFKSLYRPDDYTVTGVELVAENVTATKEQERRALEKIKAIVAELGPDSYVATAFMGCFDLAAWNIENDAADNFPERIELARAEAYKQAERAEAAEIGQEIARQASEKCADELEALNARAVELEGSAQSLNRALAEEKETATGLKMSLDAMRQENIVLKAKLYDMIVAA